MSSRMLHFILFFMLFFILEGLRGSEILRGGGLHYAHGHVPDPYLDIFWDQCDKVDTLLQNSVNP